MADFPIADPIADFRFPISDYELPTADQLVIE